MQYTILTFGCRVNQADSLSLEGQIQEYGGRPAPAESADLVVVNTCSVTASADQGARQTIRRVARLNPGARIVVTGCYATRCPDEVAALPSVVRVVSNDEKERLVDVIGLGSASGFDGRSGGWAGRARGPDSSEGPLTTAERFGGAEGPCGSPLAPGVGGRTAFTLRVQTGCDEGCTYCLIPSTRGRGRSLPIDAVQTAVMRAADAGYREIALTGVHLGSYGRDLQPRVGLSDLLERLSWMPADVVFRISSLEPMDCSPAVVEAVASSSRFAPHFHLPLQHGSNRVLAAMGRPYTRAYYRRLVDGIRARLPHASIGSDVIVGFPGEEDEEFRVGLDYLRSSPLTHLHVFPYSDRPGTPAARLTPKIGGAIIRARAEAVRAVGRELTAAFHRSQIGSLRPALALESGEVAVTDNYLKVKLSTPVARNSRIRVRITKASDGGLQGEVID
jgi:threonylcarbamoyladenosine tRNA methylthiotransferase MtaB